MISPLLPKSFLVFSTLPTWENPFISSYDQKIFSKLEILLLQGPHVLLLLDDVFKHPNESRISFLQRNPPKHPWKVYNWDKNFLLRILGFLLNSPLSQPKLCSLKVFQHYLFLSSTIFPSEEGTFLSTLLFPTCFTVSVLSPHQSYQILSYSLSKLEFASWRNNYNENYFVIWSSKLMHLCYISTEFFGNISINFGRFSGYI